MAPKIDNATLLILVAGFFLRLSVSILIPHLANVLDQFVLFSTPINSYRSLTEGIFLLHNNLNPYIQGEILHHSPILLNFFKILKNSQVEDNFNTNLFFSAIDLIICLQLIKINQHLNEHNGFTPFNIACFYMFNPFTLLTTFAKSTYLINNLVVISMFSSVMDNHIVMTTLLLSLSTYLTYYSWYFIIPICYYFYKNKDWKVVVKILSTFVLSILILFGISYKLSDNSFNFINLCYVSILKFKKITPNLGLWWYFFTEIFEFFNDFYLSVFNIYSFIFVLPISMRFIVSDSKMNLLFAIWIVIGMVNFSKAYPVLADYSLFYSSMFLFKPFYKYLKFTPVVSYSALCVVLLQSPIFYIVWMTLNSGNANFFYALGLTLNLVEMFVLSDFVWSYLQMEYYAAHPVKDDEPLPKLTQI